MSWEDILKKKWDITNPLRPPLMGTNYYQGKDREKVIRLAQDNMDKFDEEEEKLIRFYIKSLEDKYDKDTFEALRFELKKKDLLRAKGRF